jgi:hypothetical protein
MASPEKGNASLALNVPPIPNTPNYSEPTPVNTKFPNFPNGVFRPNIRHPVESKEPGGFPNAMAASMLERGFIKKSLPQHVRKDNSGLLVRGSRQIEVSVVKGMHMKDGKWVFTFKDDDDEFDVPYDEEWDFYTHTEPVPFVPRVRGRRQRGQRKQRKTRKQQGGFYPSVYGGIAGAKMLTPLIARQMMRMYEQVGHKPLTTRGETNSKTRRHKSKKLSRNKRG